jgi:predicted peptidase
MRKSLRCFCAAIALSLTVLAAHGESPATEEKLDAAPKANHQLNYLQYLPEDYAAEPERKWPLLVFLHGAGERGDDLDKVKIHGPPKLAEAGKKFPFIVIAPQCPKDSWWPWEPVMPLIEKLEKDLRVDSNRIYLTGLSMGGYGTWNLATRYPDKFAAVAPICGGGVPYLTKRIPDLPVWAFHGGKDTVVAPVESQRMIDALKKNGNGHAWLTIYPEAGHNSWTEAYSTEALWQWFLDQQRGKPGQPPSPHLQTKPVVMLSPSR